MENDEEKTIHTGVQTYVDSLSIPEEDEYEVA